jgi:hypothetical protein
MEFAPSTYEEDALNRVKHIFGGQA